MSSHDDSLQFVVMNESRQQEGDASANDTTVQSIQFTGTERKASPSPPRSPRSPSTSASREGSQAYHRSNATPALSPLPVTANGNNSQPPVVVSTTTTTTAAVVVADDTATDASLAWNMDHRSSSSNSSSSSSSASSKRSLKAAVAETNNNTATAATEEEAARRGPSGSMEGPTKREEHQAAPSSSSPQHLVPPEAAGDGSPGGADTTIHFSVLDSSAIEIASPNFVTESPEPKAAGEGQDQRGSIGLKSSAKVRPLRLASPEQTTDAPAPPPKASATTPTKKSPQKSSFVLPAPWDSRTSLPSPVKARVRPVTSNEWEEAKFAQQFPNWNRPKGAQVVAAQAEDEATNNATETASLASSWNRMKEYGAKVRKVHQSTLSMDTTTNSFEEFKLADDDSTVDDQLAVQLPSSKHPPSGTTEHTRPSSSAPPPPAPAMNFVVGAPLPAAPQTLQSTPEVAAELEEQVQQWLQSHHRRHPMDTPDDEISLSSQSSGGEGGGGVPAPSTVAIASSSVVSLPASNSALDGSPSQPVGSLTALPPPVPPSPPRRATETPRSASAAGRRPQQPPTLVVSTKDSTVAYDTSALESKRRKLIVLHGYQRGMKEYEAFLDAEGLPRGEAPTGPARPPAAEVAPGQEPSVWNRLYSARSSPVRRGDGDVRSSPPRGVTAERKAQQHAEGIRTTSSSRRPSSATRAAAQSSPQRNPDREAIFQRLYQSGVAQMKAKERQQQEHLNKKLEQDFERMIEQQVIARLLRSAEGHKNYSREQLKKRIEDEKQKILRSASAAAEDHQDGSEDGGDVAAPSSHRTASVSPRRRVEPPSTEIQLKPSRIEEVSTRLYRVGRRKPEELEKQREKAELHDCTFHPKINRSPRRSRSPMRRPSDHEAAEEALTRKASELAAAAEHRGGGYPSRPASAATSPKRGPSGVLTPTHHRSRQPSPVVSVTGGSRAATPQARSSSSESRCVALFKKAEKESGLRNDRRERLIRERKIAILKGKMESDHHFARRVNLDPSLAERFMATLVV